MISFAAINSKKTLILRQHTKRSEASKPALRFVFSGCVNLGRLIGNVQR